MNDKINHACKQTSEKFTCPFCKWEWEQFGIMEYGQWTPYEVIICPDCELEYDSLEALDDTVTYLKALYMDFKRVTY